METLKSLLPDWPAAVNSSCICDPHSHEDLTQRGKAIIEQFVPESIVEKKVLDYGCGYGHAVHYAVTNGAYAFGYDPAIPEFCSFENVQQNGPYDIIVLYDVLDHCVDPIECLTKVKSVSHAQTKIYVLTHPWCSRHGGHLYQKFNYAFAHLLFSDAELKELGCEVEPVAKIVKPILTYKTWFETVGLKIVTHDIMRDSVDPFFKKPIVSNRLIEAFAAINPEFVKFPEFQLEQSFHEFTLSL